MAVHHHTGMMEPTMMMMGSMMDNSAVGLTYTTNRPTFPPPQAHASMSNSMPNHLPPQQNPINQPQPPQLQVQPPTSLASVPSNAAKPKKARKTKKSAEGSNPNKLAEDPNKAKKKKNSNKPKTKSKPKKQGDGSEYSVFWALNQ